MTTIWPRWRAASLPKLRARWIRLAWSPSAAAHVAILIVAFALRIWRVAEPSYWFDEGYTAALLQRGWDDVIRATASDIHPPLYYLLLHWWIERLDIADEFTLRWWSVVAGVLTVALVGRLAADLYGARAGVVAAGLTAVSPMLVAYSQEARMYSLLVAVTTAGWWCLWRGWRRGGGGWWLAWGALSAIALYIHYFAAFAVIAAGIALVGALILGPNRPAIIRGAIGGGSMLATLFLPWFWIALHQLISYGSDWVPTPTRERMLDEIARAFATGSVSLGESWALVATLTVVAVAAVAAARVPAAWWLIGLAIAVPIALMISAAASKPMFHVRYVLISLPVLYALIGGGLMVGRRPVGWLALLLAAPLIWLHLSHLPGAIAAPRDDARGVVQAIAAELGDDDVVFYDAKHPFAAYTHGDDRWINPFEANDNLVQATQAALYGKREVWLAQWRASTADAQQYLRWYLAGAHTLIERRQFVGYDVHRYAINHKNLGRFGIWQSQYAAFEGNLTFTGWDALPDAFTRRVAARGGETLAIAARWSRPPGPGVNLSALLEVVDARGHVIAKSDRELLNPEHLPSGRWTPGIVLTYHQIPVPRGALPGEYELRLATYDTVTLRRQNVIVDQRPIAPSITLGVATIAPTAFGAAPEIEQVRDDQPRPDLRLTGYAVANPTVTAGKAIEAQLCWRADNAITVDLQVSLALRNPAGESARATVGLGSAYPTSRWPVGVPVCEWQMLRVPARMPPGGYQLTVSVDGGAPIDLTTVDIGPRPAPPPATPPANLVGARFANGIDLVGYEVDGSLEPGAHRQLRLHWRANDDVPIAYTAFVQLLSANQSMVAQDDAPPGGPDAPTTAWLPDETVVGRHTLAIPATARGPVKLIVGLYDPITLRRATVTSGDDHVALLDVDLGR